MTEQQVLVTWRPAAPGAERIVADFPPGPSSPALYPPGPYKTAIVIVGKPAA